MMGEDSGSLTLGVRLTRMEAKIDSIDSRLTSFGDRTTLDVHDRRIRDLEKMADKYVPDPATMLQQRTDWERIRSRLDSLDALDSYRRWVMGLGIATALQSVAVFTALYGAFFRH